MSTGKRPTILDVAAAAGVSKSLVSMVLRGDPGPSAASRAAVAEAVAAIGYRPNRAAAILAAGRTNTVGIAVDDYRNLWYVPFIRGIRSVLGPLGIRVATADNYSNEHLAVSPFDELMSLRVDGIIIAAELPTTADVPADVPVVMVGSRAGAIPGADTITVDDERGGELAADHLLAVGHLRIGHIAGSDAIARARRLGFERRLRSAGVTPVIAGGTHVQTTGGTPDTTERNGFELSMRLLAEHPDVTAVFAANDTMAMGALGAAKRLGRSVPADLSVIGFDDSPVAATALMDLTTIDARYEDLGRIAARTVVGRMEDRVGTSRPPTVARLEPRLVERASTARLRANPSPRGRTSP